MKKILFCICSVMAGLVSFAQVNNPYSKIGEDYARSVNMIVDDFNAGLVKDFSEENIMNYSKRLPLHNEVSIDIITQIVQKMKYPGFDAMLYMEKIVMPETVKALLKKLLSCITRFSGADKKNRLFQLTDEIKRESISDIQKQILLSIVAIAYAGESLSPALKGRKDRQCYVSGPDGWGYASGEVCVVLGAVTGAWIGFELCGIWCMFGGAIIGGLIGGLS